MATQHMLTTIDNPFNPFTDWDEWYAWDENVGYHTTAYLARTSHTSDELSETDQQLALEDAIDVIIKENITGRYRRVSEEIP